MPVIVLAGGRSERMGRPKALLPWPPDGLPLVVHVTRTLRDASAAAGPLAVVTGLHHQPIAAGLSGEPVTVLHNRAHDRGQLSSLVHGLRWGFMQTAGEWVMSTLVDVPAVRADTVRILMDAASSSKFRAIRPLHAGRHGHPVIWRRDVLPLLEAADPTQGARAVMRALAAASAVFDVTVDDPGVLSDIDTPEDYDRLVQNERS